MACCQYQWLQLDNIPVGLWDFLLMNGRRFIIFHRHLKLHLILVVQLMVIVQLQLSQPRSFRSSSGQCLLSDSLMLLTGTEMVVKVLENLKAYRMTYHHDQDWPIPCRMEIHPRFILNSLTGLLYTSYQRLTGFVFMPGI